MANFFLDWLQGLGRRRPTLMGMPGRSPSRHLLGAAQFGRLMEPEGPGNRPPLYGTELAPLRPYTDFMPPGAERQAAEARGEVGTPAGAARLRRGVRKHRERVAALSAGYGGAQPAEGAPLPSTPWMPSLMQKIARGGTVTPEGKYVGTAKKPSATEMEMRRERAEVRRVKRKEKAKKSVLRRPSRRKTVLR